MWILAATAALLIYIFAKADDEYVFIQDRPKPWVPKRKSINYYAWRGPFFVEDFAGGVGQVAESNAKEQNKGQFGKELGGITFSSSKWDAGIFNASVEGMETFQDLEGANNPKAEIVPTCGKCEIPKYNTTVKGAAQCHRIAKDQCRVPTLPSEEGWRHEYWNSQYRMEGPTEGLSAKLGGPGNFSQVTNNNLSAPNNLKSAQMRSIMGDWFDPRDKVSPWCYAEMYNKCMAETGFECP